MNEWNKKTTVIKGDFAEKIVDEYLEKLGFVVYEPSTSGAHAFDRLAVKDKRQMVIAECKAKARRTYYPDTGINKKHYEEYRFIQNKHKVPVFIFFVDEMEGRIYGNFLSTLAKVQNVGGKKYPSIEKGIIYFPLVNMRAISLLTDEQIRFLREHSTREYEYKKVAEI